MRCSFRQVVDSDQTLNDGVSVFNSETAAKAKVNSWQSSEARLKLRQRVSNLVSLRLLANFGATESQFIWTDSR